MLARSQFRALRSISKRISHQPSTRSWQPLLSRPNVVQLRCPPIQKRFYSDPNHRTPRDSPYVTIFLVVILFGLLSYGESILKKRREDTKSVDTESVNSEFIDTEFVDAEFVNTESIKKKSVKDIYPDSVSKELEKAIWYANEERECRKAVEHYNKALSEAEKHGLSPFSPEVLGIRTQIALAWSIFREFEQEIMTLDNMKTDCQKFLIEKQFSLSPSERNRIQATIIRASFRIAEAYGSGSFRNSAAAERYMTESIELILQQQQQFQEATQAGDLTAADGWLRGEEVGASFEQFAEYYYDHSVFYLAAPLYLRALMHSPKNCHAAGIMNALAVTLAQTKPNPGPNMQAEGDSLMDNAVQWAEKAYALAREIKPPERNQECDFVCVATTYHLGVFAERRQRYEEAKKLYAEALSLSETDKSRGIVREIILAKRKLERKMESGNEASTESDRPGNISS